MIEIFQGRIGGGKTYSAVCRILSHLCKGGHVMTNVELNWPECKKWAAKHYGVEVEDDQLTVLTFDDIDHLHKNLMAGDMSCPVLAVIDEAHLWFNSLDHSKTDREFLSFLTQSRKVHVDMIFITQHASNINAQFRRLTQFVWKFADMGKFNIMGIPWPFDQILAIQCDLDGKNVMDRNYVWKSKSIFICYNTLALLKPLEFAGERRGKKTLKRTAKNAVKIPAFVEVAISQYDLWWEKCCARPGPAVAGCLALCFILKTLFILS